MNDFILAIVPVVIGAITVPLFEQVQKGVTLIDTLPPWAKQIAAAVIAFGLTKLGAVLGVALNVVDPSQLTQENVAALASAGFTYLFKSHAQAKVIP